MNKDRRISCPFLILLALLCFLFADIPLAAGQNKNQIRLETLGYLTWVPAGDSLKKKGVTRYIRDRSFPGFNLYNSRDQSMAILMDMGGKAVHRWKSPGIGSPSWHHVELCPDGDLLVIVKDRSLIRLDWDSRVKWEVSMRFHHDVTLGGNGEIYALSRNDVFVIWKGYPYPVVIDCMVVLSDSGEIKNEIPFYPLVKNHIPYAHFSRIYQWLADPAEQHRLNSFKKNRRIWIPMGSPADILHANSLEMIPRQIPGLFEEGDFLVSFRSLDLIGVVDKNLGKFRWTWGPGVLQKPHHPVLLENGHILVFDNGDHARGYSRILEINPLNGRIFWQYRSRPPKSFFSLTRGGNQRLPNGNTLVTESDRGRVFEVTRDGKIVWEFYNPRIKKDNKTRAAIYRLTRIWDEKQFPFLKKYLGL